MRRQSDAQSMSLSYSPAASASGSNCSSVGGSTGSARERRKTSGHSGDASTSVPLAVNAMPPTRLGRAASPQELPTSEAPSPPAAPSSSSAASSGAAPSADAARAPLRFPSDVDAALLDVVQPPAPGVRSTTAVLRWYVSRAAILALDAAPLTSAESRLVSQSVCIGDMPVSVVLSKSQHRSSAAAQQQAPWFLSVYLQVDRPVGDADVVDLGGALSDEDMQRQSQHQQQQQQRRGEGAEEGGERASGDSSGRLQPPPTQAALSGAEREYMRALWERRVSYSFELVPPTSAAVANSNAHEGGAACSSSPQLPSTRRVAESSFAETKRVFGFREFAPLREFYPSTNSASASLVHRGYPSKSSPPDAPPQAALVAVRRLRVDPAREAARCGDGPARTSSTSGGGAGGGASRNSPPLTVAAARVESSSERDRKGKDKGHEHQLFGGSFAGNPPFLLESHVLHMSEDYVILEIRVNVHHAAARVRRYISRCVATSRQDLNKVGLRNHGATCYLNALLQLLFHLSVFRKEVFHLKPSAVAEALQGIFYQLHASATSVPTTSFIRAAKINPSVQSDAHEFLSEFFFHRVFKYVTSVFAFKVKYVTQCVDVSFTSSMEEQLFELSVSVGEGRPTLESAIAQELAPESLGDDALYDTGDPRFGKQRATRQMVIISLPLVLFVHIKRFDAYARKIHAAQTFPETLSLACSGRTTRYTLHSAVIHHGTTSNSGHYTVFVRAGSVDGSAAHRRCFHLDDDFVQEVQDEELFESCTGRHWSTPTSSAYILAYVREEMFDACTTNFEPPPREIVAAHAQKAARAAAAAAVSSSPAPGAWELHRCESITTSADGGIAEVSRLLASRRDGLHFARHLRLTRQCLGRAALAPHGVGDTAAADTLLRMACAAAMMPPVAPCAAISSPMYDTQRQREQQQQQQQGIAAPRPVVVRVRFCTISDLRRLDALTGPHADLVWEGGLRWLCQLRNLDRQLHGTVMPPPPPNDESSGGGGGGGSNARGSRFVVEQTPQKSQQPPPPTPSQGGTSATPLVRLRIPRAMFSPRSPYSDISGSSTDSDSDDGNAEDRPDAPLPTASDAAGAAPPFEKHARLTQPPPPALPFFDLSELTPVSDVREMIGNSGALQLDRQCGRGNDTEVHQLGLSPRPELFLFHRRRNGTLRPTQPLFDEVVDVAPTPAADGEAPRTPQRPTAAPLSPMSNISGLSTLRRRLEREEDLLTFNDAPGPPPTPSTRNTRPQLLRDLISAAADSAAAGCARGEQRQELLVFATDVLPMIVRRTSCDAALRGGGNHGACISTVPPAAVAAHPLPSKTSEHDNLHSRTASATATTASQHCSRAMTPEKLAAGSGRVQGSGAGATAASSEPTTAPCLAEFAPVFISVPSCSDRQLQLQQRRRSAASAGALEISATTPLYSPLTPRRVQSLGESLPGCGNGGNDGVAGSSAGAGQPMSTALVSVASTYSPTLRSPSPATSEHGVSGRSGGDDGSVFVDGHPALRFELQLRQCLSALWTRFVEVLTPTLCYQHGRLIILKTFDGTREVLAPFVSLIAPQQTTFSDILSALAAGGFLGSCDSNAPCHSGREADYHNDCCRSLSEGTVVLEEVRPERCDVVSKTRTLRELGVRHGDVFILCWESHVTATGPAHEAEESDEGLADSSPRIRELRRDTAYTQSVHRHFTSFWLHVLRYQHVPVTLLSPFPLATTESSFAAQLPPGSSVLIHVDLYSDTLATLEAKLLVQCHALLVAEARRSGRVAPSASAYDTLKPRLWSASYDPDARATQLGSGAATGKPMTVPRRVGVGCAFEPSLVAICTSALQHAAASVLEMRPEVVGTAKCPVTLMNALFPTEAAALLCWQLYSWSASEIAGVMNEVPGASSTLGPHNGAVSPPTPIVVTGAASVPILAMPWRFFADLHAVDAPVAAPGEGSTAAEATPIGVIATHVTPPLTPSQLPPPMPGGAGPVLTIPVNFFGATHHRLVTRVTIDAVPLNAHASVLFSLVVAKLQLLGGLPVCMGASDAAPASATRRHVERHSVLPYLLLSCEFGSTIQAHCTYNEVMSGLLSPTSSRVEFTLARECSGCDGMPLITAHSASNPRVATVRAFLEHLKLLGTDKRSGRRGIRGGHTLRADLSPTLTAPSGLYTPATIPDAATTTTAKGAIVAATCLLVFGDAPEDPRLTAAAPPPAAEELLDPLNLVRAAAFFFNRAVLQCSHVDIATGNYFGTPFFMAVPATHTLLLQYLEQLFGDAVASSSLSHVGWRLSLRMYGDTYHEVTSDAEMYESVVDSCFCYHSLGVAARPWAAAAASGGRGGAPSPPRAGSGDAPGYVAPLTRHVEQCAKMVDYERYCVGMRRDLLLSSAANLSQPSHGGSGSSVALPGTAPMAAARAEKLVFPLQLLLYHAAPS